MTDEELLCWVYCALTEAQAKGIGELQVVAGEIRSRIAARMDEKTKEAGDEHYRIDRSKA